MLTPIRDNSLYRSKSSSRLRLRIGSWCAIRLRSFLTGLVSSNASPRGQTTEIYNKGPLYRVQRAFVVLIPAIKILRIYHNVALRALLKRTERDSDADTAKRDVLPSENRKNASGSFSAHCIAMHENE